MAEKERIGYFDTMKGIAIILVIVHHALGYNGTPIEIMLESMRMPIFIFVAGLFLSFRRGFKVLAIKKINRYILPLIFFSLLYLLVYDLFVADTLSFSYFKVRIYNYIINLSLNNANAPLWFLKMLFLLCIITYCLDKVLQCCSKPIRLLIAIAICTAFAYLFECFNPHIIETPISVIVFNSQLPSAIYMLPVYYFAYLYKDIFIKPASKQKVLALLPIALVIWYFSGQEPVEYYRAWSESPYLLLLIAQVSAVYCCFAVAYALGRVPVISYYGQYSLAILGTHSIVQLLLERVFHIENPMIMLAIILLTAPALIYISTRYLPHFSAQKELIKVDENGKIRISFCD